MFSKKIRVFQLNRRIVFDKFKQPIKLSEKDQIIKNGSEITVVGWGATRMGQVKNHEYFLNG